MRGLESSPLPATPDAGVPSLTPDAGPMAVDPVEPAKEPGTNTAGASAEGEQVGRPTADPATAPVASEAAAAEPAPVAAAAAAAAAAGPMEQDPATAIAVPADDSDFAAAIAASLESYKAESEPPNAKKRGTPLLSPPRCRCRCR